MITSRLLYPEGKTPHPTGQGSAWVSEPVSALWKRQQRACRQLDPANCLKWIWYWLNRPNINDFFEHSPSWEGDNRSGGKRFFLACYGPPQIHYRVHSSLLLCHILTLLNSAHTLTVHFCRLRFNIILWSKPISHVIPSIQFCYWLLYGPLVSLCFCVRPSLPVRMWLDPVGKAGHTVYLRVTDQTMKY
jgi:hypothetical protein